VTPPTLSPTDGGVAVSARVMHTGGAMASDEVAQLYGSFRGAGAASPPLQQLLAFERLAAIVPGDSRDVIFQLPRDAFALADAGSSELRVLPGTWTLWLGGGPPANAAFGGGDVLVGELVVQ
jgi:hypothetical protein